MAVSEMEIKENRTEQNGLTPFIFGLICLWCCVLLIRYQKGQHVICAAPELLDRHIKEAGNFRYLVDPNRLIWTPYQHNELK
mmetsp:Transcript_7284/g.17957  ORF Transcript_7284/g.17957 Transcript_7284/m.17957 type:complete len:82 (-) Transcript_7284:215-460(-)